MNVNSSGDTSSGYTNAAYSSKGISGLASGIDTESVVQSMLMPVQNKIDKQTQKQQQLEWKQDAYRDVIDKINTFQDKYLSLTSDSSIRLASLYGSMTAESSSKAVSVTPGSNAVDGDFSMQVARLATKTSVASKSVGSGKMTTTDSAKAGSFTYKRDVTIKVGGDEEGFDVDLASGSKDNALSIDVIANRINSAYQTKTGDSNAKIVTVNDSVSVKNAAGKALTTKFKLGDADYEGSVRIKTTTIYKDSEGNTLTKDDEGNYKNADGTDFTGDTSTITSETTAEYETADGQALTAEYYLKDTKLEGDDLNNIKIGETVTSTLKFEAGGQDIEISGSSAGMSILGMSGTVKSSEITSGTVNTNFTKSGVVNGSVSFTLDGVTKTFNIGENADDDETINTMDELAAKVKKAFGSSVEFKKGDDGNWSVSVGGTGRQFSISANADTMEAIGFGSGTKSVSTQMQRTDTMESLGLGDGSTEKNPATFKINDVEISYTADDTIASIMSKINNSDAGVKLTYNDLGAKFNLESTSFGSGFDITTDANGAELFEKLGFDMAKNGDDYVTDEHGNVSFTAKKEGENALVNINGTTVERSSNTFSYNGQSITIKATTGNYLNSEGKYEENSDGTLKTADGTVDNKAEISTSRNVDKIVDTLKSFVEDYNTLIEDLNKMTHAEASYKKYPPLTDAQKKEMSENEIKLWEEKSKEGLLRGDRDIASFLTDMRSAMYTKGDSKFILSSIGINSSSEWSDYGKLAIDEDTLKKTLTENASEVAKFFTGTNGLATRLNDICKKTANTSSGNPGSLVTIAGIKGKATEKNNQIYDQLQKIKEKLEKLNMTYESKKERYWKQFNAMEIALSQSQRQSDYFANYM